MRNVMKATTLESRFPLLSVEHGCIVSKDADITAAFEVELPEVYTVTAEEYEAIHATWCKAIKVLPDYSVLHKQDWYVKERYRPDTGREGMGFLARSYEMHFNERPFLHHKCYLFLTKTTKERMRQQSNWNTLCRGHIVPKEMQDKETAVKFIEAVEQFARILNDSGHVRLRRLSDDEIIGTEKETGIIGRYFALSPGNVDCLEDIEMTAREMRIGDNRLCLHTLSDTEDLPAAVATDSRYERLSTDHSDCRLSFAASVGLLLPCNHIYNQYVLIGNSDEELRRFEKTARNMQSLSRYSRQNAINREWIEEYLNEAHSQGLKSVRAHFNVMAWERRRGGTETHQERCRQPVGEHGLRAAPQHDGLPDAVLGGHPRQRRRLSVGGSVPHVHRAGGVPLRRRDQLQGLALRLRHPHGGQDKRQAAAHRHLRPADEAGRDDEQKQVRIGPFGKRQVILHEPPCQAVLRTRIPRGAGRYGQLLPRAVRDDTPQDEGQGRHLLHLHGGKAHLVQPVLHGRRGVRRGEEGQHQDAAAHPVEKRERTPPQKRSRRNWAAR